VNSAPLVYFFCNPTLTSLQEDVISLAEGLVELNVPFTSNCRYWQRSDDPNDYLFQPNPDIAPDDCDIVVVAYTVPFDVTPFDVTSDFKPIVKGLPPTLFAAGRQYKTVFMDHHDGYKTVSWQLEYRQFDYIFRAKTNARTPNHENMRPWALGLRSAIIAETSAALPFRERCRKILINYGASHRYEHRSRNISHRLFDPAIAEFFEIDSTRDDLRKPPECRYERIKWEQTGFRYSRSYYERLCTTQAVACFCGDIIPGIPRDPSGYMVGGRKASAKRFVYDRLGNAFGIRKRSIQWDSFRFWESLASGCVSFNIDLEKYGVVLPEMPINWHHYVGVDFDKVHECVDRIRAEPGTLEKIAANGRAWALANYSPRAIAERFLRTVSA
jgi:hypothetical protein